MQDMSQGRAAAVRVSDQPVDAMGIVDLYENRRQITSHPFMVRLGEDPVNIHNLWTLLANFQISISQDFSRHLASLAARVEDPRIRCILAEQLNDEMGRGRFEDAHTNLFADMMSKLEPFKPSGADEPATLVPGERLRPALAELYGTEDTSVGVGAILAGEIFGKQMDQFIAVQFRRQDQVDTQSLQWLVLHEELEADHADSSVELARLVPPADFESTWRGARSLYELGCRFLDDLSDVCYSHVRV